MMAYRSVIAALWIAFLVYWTLSAIGTKRNVGPRGWWRQAAPRWAILAVIVVVLRVPAVRHVVNAAREVGPGGLGAGIAGVALCVLGFGLAVWARVHLGRNWGMPMSRKEDPELVTTGPYAIVRHPIYTGLLLAMLGSAIAVSVAWVLGVVLFGAYFVYSARREEELMLAQFPAHYAAYMKRTKMLVPFVL